MTMLESRLRAFQQADSFFPSGAISWSWGLENLVAEKHLIASAGRQSSRRKEKISAESEYDLCCFIEAQLRYRWGSFDRAFLTAALRCNGDQDYLRNLDSRIEALTLTKGLRDGSRALGHSLLAVHVELDTAGAKSYHDKVLNGAAKGHLAVMQGFLWGAIGITKDDCDVASAHSLCVGFVSAALRLGVIGHIEAQRILRKTEVVVLDVLSTSPPDIMEVYSFTPLEEIAVMRHDDLSPRLFAN